MNYRIASSTEEQENRQTGPSTYKKESLFLEICKQPIFYTHISRKTMHNCDLGFTILQTQSETEIEEARSEMSSAGPMTMASDVWGLSEEPVQCEPLLHFLKTTVHINSGVSAVECNIQLRIISVLHIL
jgi:hypothetical protein